MEHHKYKNEEKLSKITHIIFFFFKVTVMQIEKPMIDARLRVSKVS